MLKFCFKRHCHLVLSFMIPFFLFNYFLLLCLQVYVLFFVFFVFTFESIFFKCTFFMHVAIFIFLMPSPHQKLLNSTVDLEEKKTCNIMHFILLRTLEDSVLILLQ